MNSLAPAARLYGQWLLRLASDPGTPFPDLAGKERARIRIGADRMLSVPLEGGMSRLKKRDLADVALSDHGRWRAEHLGALTAIYGKTPYFPHLYPEIKEIYENEAIRTLCEMARAFHGVITRWLGVSQGLPEAFRQLHEDDPELFEGLREDLRGKADGDLSVIDAIFHLGPLAGPALMFL